jgi:uncharacterized protein (DUF1778 family)
MVKKKIKMGRPPLNEKDRRNAFITLRLKANEYKELKQDAKTEGLSLSKFLLNCWKKVRK